jgi:glycolate oxidase iron-sulfur subunit
MNKLRKYIDDRIVNSFSKIISKNIDIIKLSRHFYDKNLKIKMENDLRNIVYILKKSGIKFDYLGSEEPYPGMFLYDLGYINEFKKYSKNIYKSLKSRKIKTIIALDPHTYDLLKNKYPLFIKNFDINIIYYTDLINLKFKKSNEKITVQEPCHMVLHNNEYKAMDILNSVSDVKLPDRSGKTTMCCGGPDELLYPEISYNVSRKRYNDLKEISDKIVTVCPLCYNNLSYDNNVVDFSDFIKNLIINE